MKENITKKSDRNTEFRTIADSSVYEQDSRFQTIPKDELIQVTKKGNFMAMGDCTFHSADSLLENIPNGQMVLQCTG